jgi:hypothetical protein
MSVELLEAGRSKTGQRTLRALRHDRIEISSIGYWTIDDSFVFVGGYAELMNELLRVRKPGEPQNAPTTLS